MNSTLDCIPCLLRQSLETARSVTDDPAMHEQVLRHLLKMSLELDMSWPPPLVGQAMHRKLRELVKMNDPYKAAKSRLNRLIMDLLPELSTGINTSPVPLHAAVRLAIAANVIDMGPKGEFSDEEAHSFLRGVAAEPFFGEMEKFGQAVADAGDILYLADNAGEIAVDRLLIQELGPERVTVAVRGGPVINDATIVDASEVGMQDLAEVIDNGSDAPGTILDDCSEAFRERFHKAELIIAKGQGNFESLGDAPGNIFFLFKAKCSITAEHVGLPKGAHVLVSSNLKRQ